MPFKEASREAMEIFLDEIEKIAGRPPSMRPTKATIEENLGLSRLEGRSLRSLPGGLLTRLIRRR